MSQLNAGLTSNTLAVKGDKTDSRTSFFDVQSFLYVKFDNEKDQDSPFRLRDLG